MTSTQDTGEDETELTNNLPIATDEMKLTTSSTIQNKQTSRSFTFIATGELLIHEFVADAADSYGSVGFDCVYNRHQVLLLYLRSHLPK